MAEKKPAESKDAAATKTAGVDARRAGVAQRMLDRIDVRGGYQKRVDETGRSGKDRVLAVALDGGLHVLRDQIVVNAVVYDGNQGDFARPVILVLPLDDAKKLVDEVGFWVEALDRRANANG